MADAIKHDTISLAVWDVPMPAVAGETFTIKAGAKAADSRSLAGCRAEVSDAKGAIVAIGTLGDAPWTGTEALYWTTLNVPAPAGKQVAEYTVRLTPDRGGGARDMAATRFHVATAGKPEHRLTVTVTEQDTKEALAGVEIRLGPFHARTDAAGRAQLHVCKGGYQLVLWRNGHIAAPTPITIDDDTGIALTMRHVPEEHPDARWIR